MRAAAESILSRRLMDCYWTKLQEAGLEKAFLDIEMPSVITLARMEINGFGEMPSLYFLGWNSIDFGKTASFFT